MGKITTTLKRIRGMSFKRMDFYARKAAADSDRSRAVILADMAFCAWKYGVGYLDYLTFGFAHLNAQKRATFMTMDDNLRLIRRFNDPEKSELFENKLLFNKTFSDLLGREFWDLREISAYELGELLTERGSLFVKEPTGFGGLGVKKLRAEEEPDPQALRERLLSAGMFDLEQEIVQHIDMNRLCATSVNSLRIVTLRGEDGVHFMYALVRMGQSGHVDNISSGGMYSPLSREGVITAPAFCDKTGAYYERHPVTKTELIDFEIPLFSEALALAMLAAERVPEVRYVGWDVAISVDGPVLIEGNTIPSYDMCQNYYHLPPDKTGILPRFREVVGQF